MKFMSSTPLSFCRKKSCTPQPRKKTFKMAPYDSDDSLDDEQDYTETDVLLGYASKEANGETVSRLGGRPVSY